MNNIIRNLFGGGDVVVWSNDGIVQGKAYCKENEIANYIREMLKYSNGKLSVVIEKGNRA